jgi:hypothetical protein
LDKYGPEAHRLRRKADQAWNLAGMARQDGDHKDEKKWTDEARRLEEELRELIRNSQ